MSGRSRNLTAREPLRSTSIVSSWLNRQAAGRRAVGLPAMAQDGETTVSAGHQQDGPDEAWQCPARTDGRIDVLGRADAHVLVRDQVTETDVAEVTGLPGEPD